MAATPTSPWTGNVHLLSVLLSLGTYLDWWRLCRMWNERTKKVRKVVATHTYSSDWKRLISLIYKSIIIMIVSIDSSCTHLCHTIVSCVNL
jgi:hypothetical protein